VATGSVGKSTITNIRRGLAGRCSPTAIQPFFQIAEVVQNPAEYLQIWRASSNNAVFFKGAWADGEVGRGIFGGEGLFVLLQRLAPKLIDLGLGRKVAAKLLTTECAQ